MLVVLSWGCDAGGCRITCVLCIYIAVCVLDLHFFFFAASEGEYIFLAISPYRTVHFVFAN